MGRIGRLLGRASWTLALAACSSIEKGREVVPLDEAGPQINATRETRLLLSPGDRLEVRIHRFPEWLHTSEVGPDGRASFYLVDDLAVAGMTLEELDRELTRAYAEHVSEPEVTVFLLSASERTVVVLGEVRAPGEVPFDRGELTLLEALGRVGGHLKESARLKSVLLVRREHTDLVSWVIDARPGLWGRADPVLLQPHDVIYIPNTTIDKVDIWIDKYIRQLIPLPGFSTAFVTATR